MSTIQEPPLLIEQLKLDVHKGEVVSLIGASGAGKTTLLRIIAGLESHYVGEVKLNSKVVSGPSRRVQIVFQDNRLLPWLNVARNIQFAVGKGGPMLKMTKVRELLDIVRLKDREHALPKNLSGGEESRVAFARVFMEPPELLLLDEPFKAIDIISKIRIQTELLRFIRETETTTIMVSHSIEDAIRMSDRIIVLTRSPLRVFQEFRMTGATPRDPAGAALTGVAKEIVNALMQTVDSKDPNI